MPDEKEKSIKDISIMTAISNNKNTLRKFIAPFLIMVAASVYASVKLFSDEINFIAVLWIGVIVHLICLWTLFLKIDKIKSGEAEAGTAAKSMLGVGSGFLVALGLFLVIFSIFTKRCQPGDFACGMTNVLMVVPVSFIISLIAGIIGGVGTFNMIRK
jgi:hypothetical protein